MKKIVALLLTLAVLLSAALASADTFRQGIDPEYPPFSYLDDNGDYAGFDVEMCQKVCEILGWGLEIVPINWDTKDIQLEAKEIDCIWSGLTVYANGITEDRFAISTPYSDNSQMILTKKGTGIETFDDLAGKVVGVQMGTSAEAALTGEGEAVALGETFGALQPYENYNIAFTDLTAGAIDAIAIDAPVARDKIAKYGDEYYCLEESFASEKYGICFRKEDAELCAQVEDAYMQLVADGTYIALGEKYGLDTSYLVLAAQ